MNTTELPESPPDDPTDTADHRRVADQDALVLSQPAYESFVTECEAAREPSQALRDLMMRL